MPKMIRTAARKANGADWTSKALAYGWKISAVERPCVGCLGSAYKFHGLAEDEDETLVCDGPGRSEEEEADGEMEEGEGADDGVPIDEAHLGISSFLEAVRQMQKICNVESRETWICLTRVAAGAAATCFEQGFPGTSNTVLDLVEYVHMYIGEYSNAH